MPVTLGPVAAHDFLPFRGQAAKEPCQSYLIPQTIEVSKAHVSAPPACHVRRHIHASLKPLISGLIVIE